MTTNLLGFNHNENIEKDFRESDHVKAIFKEESDHVKTIFKEESGDSRRKRNFSQVSTSKAFPLYLNDFLNEHKMNSVTSN
jgi:hypothetical protein